MYTIAQRYDTEHPFITLSIEYPNLTKAVCSLQDMMKRNPGYEYQIMNGEEVVLKGDEYV